MTVVLIGEKQGDICDLEIVSLKVETQYYHVT